jgi:hypothetical protein
MTRKQIAKKFDQKGYDYLALARANRETVIDVNGEECAVMPLYLEKARYFFKKADKVQKMDAADLRALAIALSSR